MGNMMHSVANDPSYQHVGSFDDELRIFDNLRNRNTMASSSFGISNSEIDNDISIYHPDFNRPSFRNPFADTNHLTFESNSDNDLRSYKPLTVHNGLLEVFSRPIYDEASKNKSPTDFKFWIDHVPTKDRNTFIKHQYHNQKGVFNNVHKDHWIITRPKQNELAGSYDTNQMPHSINSYNFETGGAKISGRFKDTSDIQNLGSPLIFRDFGSRITNKCE